EVQDVPEAGQVVGQRRLARLPIERRLLDRDRGLIGDALHESQFGVVEDRAVELVDHLDHAVEGVVAYHRHAEHAARDEPGPGREAISAATAATRPRSVSSNGRPSYRRLRSIVPRTRSRARTGTISRSGLMRLPTAGGRGVSRQTRAFSSSVSVAAKTSSSR